MTYEVSFDMVRYCTVLVKHRVKSFIKAGERFRNKRGREHPQIIYFKNAAVELGINLEYIGFRVYEFKLGSRTRRINYLLRNDCDNALSFWLCGHKYLTFTILKKNGITRVPYSKIYSLKTIGLARSEFARRGKVSVLKPCYGTSSGKGVTVGVRSIREFNKAAYNALIYDRNFVVEDYIYGQNFRLLFFGNDLLSTLRKIPANVRGDGVKNLRRLIYDENKRRALEDPVQRLNPILIDDEVRHTFLSEGMGLDYIPKRGEVVYVRRIANFSSGGEAEELGDSVHPEIIEYCKKIMSIMDVKLAGIDVIAEDLRKPLRESRLFINEVNTCPGILSHYMVRNKEKRKDVAKEILRRMFEIC